MFSVNEAKNIISKKYPKVKVLAILETDEYYICHLSDDSTGPIRKAVRRDNGNVEILGVMEICAVMNTTKIKKDHLF